MKNIKTFFAIGLSAVLLTSCGKDETEYLYDKDDSEYIVFQELAAAKCLNESKIFSALDQTNEHLAGGLKEGAILRVTEKQKHNGTDDGTITSYIKLTDYRDNASEDDYLEMGYVNPNPSKNMTFTFTKKMNKDLLDGVARAVCTKNSLKYSAGSLDRGDKLVFTDRRIDVIKFEEDGTTPKNYIEEKETLTILVSYPTILHLWNGTKFRTDKSDRAADATTKTDSSEFTMAAISQETCDKDELCKNANFNGNKVYTVKVNKTAYTNDALTSKLVTFEEFK